MLLTKDFTEPYAKLFAMSSCFKIHSEFSPTGDQPDAIKELSEGVLRGDKHQVLLGVTGSGKTFTIANVIAEIERPTLIIAPNKTLAAQLYGEMKDLFPENSVRYFVSYYDYYQPEAYIPTTDTYTIDMPNGDVITFPIRYGGPGGEEREEDPLIWLHNNQSLKAMEIGKSLYGEDFDCVWTCSLDEVINSIESGSATAKDFILVQGFCVWQKENDSAGGIKGQVLAGNFEAPVITGTTNNDDVWSCLIAQDQLSEESLSANFRLSFDAWSAGRSLQIAQNKDGSKNVAEDCRTVFESDVRVSTLCDEALLNWMKIFLLGNAEYYRQ